MSNSARKAKMCKSLTKIPDVEALIVQQDVSKFLAQAPETLLFDLVVTSPPYNIGKDYERKLPLQEYLSWQKGIIEQIIPLLSPKGSLCWQVGNYVSNGVIQPLDMYLHPIFDSLGLHLRNRIVWGFGHGLNCQYRFSGRYEVVLWYTKDSDKSYTFNLDAVRVPSKYPAKRHFKGPNAGKVSANPLGKNPSDVWDNIPNVKSNHVEKTDHPCQFPVGLVERLILALTNEKELVFDPFCGVASAGVASLLHDRRFIGCEVTESYARTGLARLKRTIAGHESYRPHDKPLYDHRKSKLSIPPEDTAQ